MIGIGRNGRDDTAEVDRHAVGARGLVDVEGDGLRDEDGSVSPWMIPTAIAGVASSKTPKVLPGSSGMPAGIWGKKPTADGPPGCNGVGVQLPPTSENCVTVRLGDGVTP